MDNRKFIVVNRSTQKPEQSRSNGGVFVSKEEVNTMKPWKWPAFIVYECIPVEYDTTQVVR